MSCAAATANADAARAAAREAHDGAKPDPAAGRAPSLNDEEWEAFLNLMTTANQIRIKAIQDAAAKNPKDALKRHFAALGYGESEPVDAKPEAVAEEKARRKKCEDIILQTFDGGKAHTQGYGEAAVAMAWPHVPKVVKDAPMFRGLATALVWAPPPSTKRATSNTNLQPRSPPSTHAQRGHQSQAAGHRCCSIQRV